MGRKRNQYLDVIKAICMILVVVGHCLQYGSGDDYFSEARYFDNPVFAFIYSFHMPLFMLISGYLFAESLKNKKWNEVLLSKAKQLLVPLLCWSTVSLAIRIIKSLTGMSEETVSVVWAVKNLISGFVYGPWFLWAIWWCSFVIILVRRLFKDHLLVYIAGSLLTLVIPDALNLSLYKYMWPFFLLAYLFNQYDLKTKWKKVYSHKVFVLGCMILFCVLLLFYNRECYIYISGFTVLNKDAIRQVSIDGFRFLVGLAGSIGVMYLVYALMKVLPDAVKEILAYIGRNTLGIYVISGYFFAELLPKITAPLQSVNGWYLAVETVCILGMSVLLTAVLKKTKVTNRLFLGGR